MRLRSVKLASRSGRHSVAVFLKSDGKSLTGFEGRVGLQRDATVRALRPLSGRNRSSFSRLASAGAALPHRFVETVQLHCNRLANPFDRCGDLAALTRVVSHSGQHLAAAEKPRHDRQREIPYDGLGGIRMLRISCTEQVSHRRRPSDRGGRRGPIRVWLGHVRLEKMHRYAEITVQMESQARDSCESSVNIPAGHRRKGNRRDDGTLLEVLKSLCQ